MRIWGDGPDTKEGRLNKKVRGQLFDWCEEILIRGFERGLEGTDEFPVQLPKQRTIPSSQRLGEIVSNKVPSRVAIGKYCITAPAMRYIAKGLELKEDRIKEFKAGHMVNLECTQEFNEFLGTFLEQCVM